MNTSAYLTTLTLTAAGLAAACDVRTRKIPNWLTFSAILIGLILNVLGGGLSGLAGGVLGAAAGIGLLLIPFATGGMGAGDVKILAAVGAINGAAFAFRAFVYGAFAGGLMAGALLAVRWFSALRSRKSLLEQASVRRACLRSTLPYGVAIFAGTVAAYALK